MPHVFVCGVDVDEQITKGMFHTSPSADAFPLWERVFSSMYQKPSGGRCAPGSAE